MDDDDDDDNCVMVNHYDGDDDVMLVAPCCLPVSATALALCSVISYWLWQNVVPKHPKTKSKDIFSLQNQDISQSMSSWKSYINFELISFEKF